MKRVIGLVFVFFSVLAGSYAFADEGGELSPQMQCLVDCMDSGPYTLGGCVRICKI